MAKHNESSGLEPAALAMVLCDYVHVDPITGRHTALGTFHGIEAEDFPVIYPKMAVYAALTDGRGRMPITIRLIDVDEDYEPLWSHVQEVVFEDPLDVQELAVERRDIELPYPGVFRLQLLAAGVTIMERGILATRYDEGDDYDD